MTPTDRTDVEALRLLAVDLETSGLSPADDRILAVGWVPVDGTRINLAGARRHVVHQPEPGDAVTIHRLTHDDLETGRPLAEVLTELRDALEGRVLLAHHAPFDVGFLQAALRAHGLPPLRGPVVCTLVLQRRLLTAYGEIPRGALRLWRARAHYGLPTARAHDALGDALACAELYLAQVAELGRAGRPVRLRDVRRREGWAERLRAWWLTRRRRIGGRGRTPGR